LSPLHAADGGAILHRAQEWSKGLPGVLAYPADVLVKSSLVDGEPTWIIDYTNAPSFGGRSISYFEDEMREVIGSGEVSRSRAEHLPGLAAQVGDAERLSCTD
jgi:hypothetical protein